MEPIPWRIALASAIGTSHVGTGLPCQDSAAHKIIETENCSSLLVAVVCDGAGSAAHSEIGSRLAAETFIDIVTGFIEEGGRLASINREIASVWLEQIATTLGIAAKDAGHAVRDYACTLLGAIVGESTATFIQIGDGAIVVSEGAEDGWSWVFWPQHGEFANTTNFVVSDNAADVMDFTATSNRIAELAIFSDGIENLVLHHGRREVHAAFFDAMFPPVRKAAMSGFNDGLSQDLATYLTSPRICEKTDDDKTLILASRREATVLSGPSSEPPSDA